MISKKNFKLAAWQFLACSLCLLSCQKDGDIIDRYLMPANRGVITTIIADGQGNISRDSIFWYQDASGKVDSAYRYDSLMNRRIKVLQVTRSVPNMIRIDDADVGRFSALILFNSIQQPYKVIFFNRITSARINHGYNFTYGGSIVPYGLETYMDSIHSSMTMESYGWMSMGSGYNYPNDSFEKISMNMGTFYMGHIIHNQRKGADLSSFSFIPFVSQVVTSNLLDRAPSAISRDVFDAYIWGEVMRPWLPKNIILGFDAHLVYPVKQLTAYNYSAQVSAKQIIYSDGKRTIKNYYP